FGLGRHPCSKAIPKCLPPSRSPVEDGDGEEHPPDGQKGTSENRRERQALLVRPVPEAQPQARAGASPLVLSQMPPGNEGAGAATGPPHFLIHGPVDAVRSWGRRLACPCGLAGGTPV